MSDVSESGIRTVSVRGKGHIDVKPDEASFSVNVEKVALSQEDASRAASRLLDKVIRILLDIGVNKDDIATKEISIAPYRKWSENAREYVPCGGKANQSITVKLNDISLIGPCFDRLSSLGGIEIPNVTLSKKDKSHEYSMARKKAFSDAVSKASTYAESAGMNLGNPISIKEIEEDDYPLRVEYELADREISTASDNRHQYNAPDLSLDICVSVVFELTAR